MSFEWSILEYYNEYSNFIHLVLWNESSTYIIPWYETRRLYFHTKCFVSFKIFEIVNCVFITCGIISLGVDCFLRLTQNIWQNLRIVFVLLITYSGSPNLLNLVPGTFKDGLRNKTFRSSTFNNLIGVIKLNKNNFENCRKQLNLTPSRESFSFTSKTLHSFLALLGWK